MGSYVNSILTKDERVISETRISWLIYTYAIFCSLASAAIIYFLYLSQNLSVTVLTLIFIAINAAIWLVYWIRRKASEFVVTTRRVIYKTGIISRDAFEMPLNKIESIDLNQSIPGRIFNYGNVTIHGTGDTAKEFVMIENPVKFRHEIDQAAENVRSS